MSSLPGLTLEDYLAWNFSLIVEDQSESNFSLGVAEAIGTITPRPVLTKEQFAQIVALYEEHREHVEQLLEDFDEETQSWRTYAGYCFEFLPDYDDEVRKLIDKFTA